ncbi:T9SS type A sorting domain-containing protein [Formosa sp. PL04]|uniref:galactose-binding domain-containing protein n=1 Tax=Formosa sp. PL04 TaxID=3081755 RepID=UPI002981E499|nr:T9SS type A sorting domain-containing protein [Formosa sp. PL04]MDW5290820.1 T9SS type A sorting domain-containing protein [Formosa sp. PL04]
MKKQLQKLLSLALLIIAIGASKATAQSNAMHDRALDYKGTWGVRILHATAYDAQNPDGTGVTAENFDVDALMTQLDQLTTINHVVINLNRGHQASWYSAPYPEKSAEIGAGFFPTRDLFGELLDALNSRDIKALVYFSGVGYDHDYPTAAQNAQWDTYLANNYPIENYTGTTPEKRQRNAATADIIEYYSLKYGTKIDGWWFDRCYGSEYTVAEKTNLAVVARAGNPNAFFTLHAGTTGSPLQQRAPECDFTAGHPTLMAFQPPWTETSTRSTGVGSDMVEDIEAGPWIDINGNPDSSEGTALGAILMPFQENWRNGAADFPTDLAFEWTTRTMEAEGMYTWAVARVGSEFATSQFDQLKEINTRIAEYLGDTAINLALNGTATQSTTLSNAAASRAIDDNTNGVFNAGSVTASIGPDAWWEVDLGDEYTINDINLFNRTDACCTSRLANFTVSVINSNGTTTYSQTITTTPTPSVTIDADGVLGQTIRVQSNLTSTLNLAEVQVYGTVATKLDQTITFNPFPSKEVGDADFDHGVTASSGLPVTYSSLNTDVATIVNGQIHIVSEGTSYITATQAGNNNYNAAPNVSRVLTVTASTVTPTNLALNGTATQSTTLNGAAASRAIDDNTNGIFTSGSVTAVQGPNAWWEVELDNNYSINDINVFNRTDACCTSRLSDFTVSIINSSGATTFSQTITNEPSPSVTINVGGAIGQVIRVQSNLTTTLNLAEVQVFGSNSSLLQKSASKKETLSISNNTDTETKFLVYPNPVSDIITIDFNSTSTAKMQIIDYLGKTVISDEIQNGTKSIDLSHLSSGLYFIKVSNQQETFTRKIIKQ